MSSTSRVIVLVDMDCFYCQVEEQLNPGLKGKPMAVVQYNAWRGGGIVAVNYPAREQGVTRHMRGNDARKKCPTIQLVQVPEVRGKADLTKYRDAGKRVADVLTTFTPLLQRASVDEAYLDITELVKNRLEISLRDLTLNNLANTFIVGCDTKDFLDNVITNKEFSESNLNLAVGGLIAEEIRSEVYNKTGYRCSAGIAHNKILAKLVCGLHKPNKQTILPPEAVKSFFETMPINKVYNLGGKFGQTLSEDLQITFMGELAKFTEKELMDRYDEKTANWLYNLARGIDLGPVTTKLISKSIACCKTFQGKAALTTSEAVQHWLSELAEEMVERLEKDLKENNRKAKQMVVSFTQEINRKEVSSSRTQALILYNSQKLAQSAFELINKYCLRTDGSYHLKFLGLSASHFEDVTRVREITTFFKVEQTHGNYQKNEEKDTNATSYHLANNSVKELNSSITDQNFDTMDYDKEDQNVYLQLTQELQENINDLSFYDDNFRIKQELASRNMSITDYSKNSVAEENFNNHLSADNTKILTEKSPSSSFFSKYFHNVKPTVATGCSEINKEEVLHFTKCDREETNNCEATQEETLTEVCIECKKNIPESEIISHKDYHFALQLAKNQTDFQKTNTKMIKCKVTQKTAKRKSATAGNNRDLTTFFKKDVLNDSLNFMETCPECKRRIKAEEMNSHKDYHLAKKLHLEINSVNTASLSIKANKNKTNKNSGKSNVTVTSFFKPL